jgi:hypothetical protein
LRATPQRAICIDHRCERVLRSRPRPVRRAGEREQPNELGGLSLRRGNGERKGASRRGLHRPLAGGPGLLAAGAVIGYLAGPAIAAEVTGGGLLGALIGGEEVPRDLSILAVTFGAGVYSVYHGIQTISGGLAQCSQAAAACRSQYGPS